MVNCSRIDCNTPVLLYHWSVHARSIFLMLARVWTTEIEIRSVLLFCGLTSGMKFGCLLALFGTTYLIFRWATLLRNGMIPLFIVTTNPQFSQTSPKWQSNGYALKVQTQKARNQSTRVNCSIKPGGSETRRVLGTAKRWLTRSVPHISKAG